MSTSVNRSQPVSVAGSLYDLVEGLTERLNRQEPVDFESVVAAHPAHAEELRRVWPSLRILAGLHSADGRSAVSFPPLTMTSEGALTGVLGDFRLVREIGRGGMGVVYEAEQISLGRTVALKVLPFAGVLDDRQLHRFRNEARAAAGLHHTRIVPVYAVGCERGVHYYAMEYIEGRTLASVIGEWRSNAVQSDLKDSDATRSVSPEHAGDCIVPIETSVLRTASTACGVETTTTFRMIAEWIAQVADALDYAHSVGIVHRDVKPSNLLLDARGQIWITDFGLAQVETDAGLTMTGDILGTLRYMSPEQALGQRGVVDQRADVYSLGATLYELLALAPLWSGNNRVELLHHIEHDDPPLPRRLNPTIPAELETIVLKAIAKDPAARYRTAKEFADDLRRFLRDEPIRARRPTWTERVRKWSRRHRVLVRSLAVAAAISFVSLATANVLIVREHNELVRQRNIAREKETLARQKEHEARQSEQRVRDRESVIRDFLYADDIQLAAQSYRRGEIRQARQRLEMHVPSAGRPDLRGFEWHYLWDLVQDDLHERRAHDSDVYHVLHSPDGKWLASAGRDGRVVIANAVDGTERARLQSFPASIDCLGFSSDGRLLATAEAVGCARVWDWQTGREVVRFDKFVHPLMGVYLTPDQKYLLATDVEENVRKGGRITAWNMETQELHAVIDGYRGIAVHAETQTLAARDDDGGVGMWTFPDFQVRSVWKGNTAPIDCAAFSPDGKFLATGSVSGDQICLWYLDGLSKTVFQEANLSRVRGLTFTPDGRALISTHEDGTVRLWDVGTRTTQRVLQNSQRQSWWTAVSSDGTFMETACSDGSIVSRRLATMPQERRRVLEVQHRRFGSVAIDADKRRLAIADDSADVALLDAESGKRLATVSHPEGLSVVAAAFSADGRSLWIGDGRRTVQRLDVATGESLDKIPLEKPVNGLIVSPQGGWIAAQFSDFRTSMLWNAESGRPFHTVDGRPMQEIGVFVRFRNEHEIISTRGDDLSIWDMATAQLQRRIDQVPWVNAIAVSPEGSLIGTATPNGVVHFWDAVSGQHRANLLGHRGAIVALAFSPDGRTLVSATTNGEIKLWHVPTGQYLFDLNGGWSGGVNLLTFTADGRRLLGAVDGAVIYSWGYSAEESARYQAQ